MGILYEVIHTETNRRHALKVMHAHLFKSDEMRERFKREARITAEIQSEHVVYVSDAGIDAATRTPFMVMELLQGEELGEHIEHYGHLPAGLALTYLRQIASALDRMHAANIIHRDLKPNNLFLTARDDGSPRIKILDFGVAKMVEDSMAAQTTQSLGTPLYMAPEQANPKVKLTPAADVYALALVVFAMLAGKSYWETELKQAGGTMGFIPLALRGPQVPAVTRAEEYGVLLPALFDAWFQKATALRPEERFQSAGSAIQALDLVFASTTGGRISTLTSLPVYSPEPRTITTSIEDRVSRTSIPMATPLLTPASRPVAQTGGTIGALSSSHQDMAPDRSKIWVGLAVAVVAALSVSGVILGISFSSKPAPADASSADFAGPPPASAPEPSSVKTPVVTPSAESIATAEPSASAISSSSARPPAPAPPSPSKAPVTAKKPLSPPPVAQPVSSGSAKKKGGLFGSGWADPYQ